MYIPLYSEGEQGFVFRWKFIKFAQLTVSLPLTGFTVCVILSILKDFESANFTHCNVFNALPSVSAAIGNYYPQNVIWKTTIATHSLPRLILATLYFQYYSRVISRRLHGWVLFSYLLNITEIICLIGLSFWSSSENYPVHKACFITFIATSQVYMLITCCLSKWHRIFKPTDVDKFTTNLKWYLFIINFTSFGSAAYFFLRHNSYCEPMVYSMFAASEYVVILTNMAYHMCSCYDFGDKDLLIRNFGISIN